MEILADVLKWIGIAGVIAWMALNVFVGYELLVKDSSQAPRRNRRTSLGSPQRPRLTAEQRHSLQNQPAR